MDAKISLLKNTLGENRLKIDEPLKYQTYTKQDKNAPLFYIATSQKELVSILDTAYDLKMPFMVFGSGTKLAFNDKSRKKLIIKNRTSNIKIGGIKGAVSKNGIGIKEALLEVDSGVSIQKLNEYLNSQNLLSYHGMSSVAATVGGSIFFDTELQSMAQKIVVWQDGSVFDIEPFSLKINEHVVLTVVLQVRARNI